jgi:hypothetical protein
MPLVLKNETVISTFDWYKLDHCCSGELLRKPDLLGGQM